MKKFYTQMLIAISILLLGCMNVHSQPLELGQSVATSYDGMNGAYNVLRVKDIRNRPPFVVGGNRWIAPEMFGVNWTKTRMNDVFGIALDDANPPNIYVSSTSMYCTQPNPTPAHIYKIDGTTWNVIDYVLTNNITGPPGTGVNWIPNTGPGLGNLCWDKFHSQIFVTNHEDGKIYRIVDNGSGTAGLVQSTFDPYTLDGGTVGFVDRRERLWGIGVYGTNTSDVRVYFARWRSDGLFTNTVGDNEIWSIALDNAGEFVPSTLRLEINLPPLVAGGNFSNPVSDIEFSFTGEMIVAERTMIGDSGPCFAHGSWAHSSRVLEYPRDGMGLYNDLIYTWHRINGSGNKVNAAGGVDFGYGQYDRNTNTNSDCDSMFIATGDYLFPVTGGRVYGMQLSDRSTNGLFNIEDFSHFIDMDDIIVGTQDKNSLGDVDVYRKDICSDTNDCVTIVKDTVYCDSLGNYIYQFQVKNESPTKFLNQVEIVVDSPGMPNYVVASPSTINIMPSIPPGGISNVYTVNLIGPGAVARTEVCFTLSVRFENDDCPWCCYIEKCIKLPDCYSCGEVLKDSIWCDDSGQYFFSFVLQNNTPFPVTKVQITSPGVTPITFVPQMFTFGMPVLSGQPTPVMTGQILGGSPGVSFPVKFKLFYNEDECCEFEVIYTFPPCGHEECQCGEWKFRRYRVENAAGGDTNYKPFNCNSVIGVPPNTLFHFVADFSCLPNDTNLCGDTYKLVIYDGVNTTSLSQSGMVNHTLVMNTDYQVTIYTYCGGRLCDSCVFRVRRTSPAKTELDGSKFGVSQNYPNPFNPTTVISFAVPVQSVVQLNIYDVSGRLVSTLVNNVRYEAGVYTVEFDGNNLPSGMYFYRFRTEGYIETRKMLLIK
jgi:hypothetical protein